MNGNANVTLVTLSRLNPRQAALLVAQVASERALSPRLVDRIVAQADGVPLFIEELTKAMLEIEAAGSARPAEDFRRFIDLLSGREDQTIEVFLSEAQQPAYRADREERGVKTRG